MKRKNICIIGGAGYIGSVLTDEFLKAGHTVTVIDLLKRGSDGIIIHKKNPFFRLINADFMVLPLSKLLKEQEIVIHLAAIVGDPACAKEPELATQTNVEGVYYLIEKCNKVDVEKLFFASTASVYGSNSEVCTEETKPNPLSHYAKTKFLAERLIQKKSDNGIIFRFGTMYGLSPNMRYDIIVNRLVYNAVKDKEFSVYDGKQFRGFLHPKDLAYFFMELFNMNLERYVGDVFNLVSENLSMLELGQLINVILPYARMKLIKEKEDERSYICRCFKAYAEFGFNPYLRVRDGIKEIELYLLRQNILANQLNAR